MSVDLFKRVAVQIGAKLCQEAIWHEGRCTWIGLEITPSVADVCSRVLGSTLYGGTAGIAYFLADLFAATSDPVFRHTALGALRHSNDGYGALWRTQQLGFFDGAYGVRTCNTLAAALVSGADQILPLERIESFGVPQGAPNPDDIISGDAGIALSLLSAGWDNSAGAEAVRPPADRLMAIPVTKPQLAGFAHGAAGLCASLGLLGNRLQCERYTARSAEWAHYVSRLFNETKRDWPDLRAISAGGTFLPAAIGWCHGAPGILLASDVAPDNAIKVSLTSRALEATAEQARRFVSDPEQDVTLCHGSLGYALCLHVHGVRVHSEQDIQLAVRVAKAACRQKESVGVWPNALSKVEESPQLLTGTAGIGHALLQIAGCSSLPCVLDPASLSGRRVRGDAAGNGVIGSAVR